jgi:hypothetical protein
MRQQMLESQRSESQQSGKGKIGCSEIYKMKFEYKWINCAGGFFGKTYRSRRRK